MLLECMPLALTHAAAYIKRRGRRSSARQYVEEFCSGEMVQASLLDRDLGDHRRYAEATNPILKAWQISFEYLLGTRRPAADLLSMMSLCDLQAIPDSLPKINIDDEQSPEGRFEDDIEVLLGSSFISTSVESSVSEMHSQVQIATRRRVEPTVDLELQAERLAYNLDRAFPWNVMANEKVCQTLFAHAKSALHFVPSRRFQNLEHSSRRLE